MAIEPINVGSGPDAGNGESLRSALQKVNANFTDLDTTKAESVHTHTESDITDLGDYLPLAGGTLVGMLSVVSSVAVPFEVRPSVTGNRAQILPTESDNDLYIRNAQSDGTVDGSIIIQGNDDTLRFRPGGTGGTKHKVWHAGEFAYESGAWTPAWQFSTSGSATTAIAQGRYIRVGSWCWFYGRIATGSLSSPSGDVFVSGLPFTSLNTTDHNPAVTVGAAWLWNTDMVIRAHIGVNSGRVTLTRSATNGAYTTVKATDLSTTAGTQNHLMLSGVYHVN